MHPETEETKEFKAHILQIATKDVRIDKKQDLNGG
jgi:CRISPR-associated protein Cas1